MLKRAFTALGRLLAMSLFGTVAFLMIPLMLLAVALMLALGLASVVGLFGGLVCLLKGDYRLGLALLGGGAGGWVGNMLIWDRLFTARDFFGGWSGAASGSVPASSLSVDFNQ